MSGSGPETFSSAALFVVGAAGTGLGFLTTTVNVPVWFLLAAVALPTGDVLAFIRGWIPDPPDGG